MKANKNNISIETAKFLKDCKIPSDIYFIRYDPPKWMTKDHIEYREFIQSTDVSFSDKEKEFYPAYSWQEILWENPKKFFSVGRIFHPEFSYEYELDSFRILEYLQKGEYEQADAYFRRNCILIKKYILITSYDNSNKRSGFEDEGFRMEEKVCTYI